MFTNYKGGEASFIQLDNKYYVDVLLMQLICDDYGGAKVMIIMMLMITRSTLMMLMIKVFMMIMMIVMIIMIMMSLIMMATVVRL